MDGFPRESTLEKYIKDFVCHNTAEKVELYLQNDIIIRPLSRKGSIIVGIFWSNVLQCDRNFPPYPFIYEKSFSEESQEETLSVTVDDITFVVHLTTGKLSIRGQYVYEWFTKKFRDLLNNFDLQFGERWKYEASPVHRSVHGNNSEECSDIYKTETEKYLLLENTEHPSDSRVERKLQEGEEDLVTGVGNLNIDQELFTPEELTAELNGMAQGGLHDGFAVVYKVWKSLLNKWFATKDTQVYLCTPLLDSQRLKDIVELYLQHRTLGDIKSFYIQASCDPSGGKSLTHIQKSVLASYNEKLQTFVEYRVLRKMVQPLYSTPACFVAGICEGKAEVLATSAAFHGDHFVEKKAQMAWFTTMGEEEFKKRYVEVLEAPNAFTTY